MNDDRAAGATSADSPAARWLTVHDELLRGIAHAFSNRIATIGAVAYTLENGDVPGNQILQSLRDESGRMEGLLQALRAMPGRPGAAAEPATANDVCAAAVTVHAHHPDFRDTMCDIVVDAAVYPVWIEPSSFAHALLVALTSAKRNSINSARVSLHVTGDAHLVRFHVAAASGASDSSGLAESDARAAQWLMTPFGGTAHTVPGGCELQVPTLLAARRAQQRR